MTTSTPRLQPLQAKALQARRLRRIPMAEIISITGSYVPLITVTGTYAPPLPAAEQMNIPAKPSEK